MCGLVAVLRRDAPVDPLTLAAMRDALAHRGPDAAAQWIGEGVGLAHRRLSIIDRSEAADQPMFSADGRYVIVFNGEIYNYLELKAELAASGVVFRTAGDTEVLLEALALWGEAALPRLNGMFAFALWDRRDRQLLVARDRFGEKPLFMAAFPGGVALASEMKALLRDPSIPDTVDPRTLQLYAASAYYEERDYTFFEAIKRVPAASAIRFDASGEIQRVWRYWTPDYEAVNTDLKPREGLERFHDLLQKSVRMRLRADVPVGSSLSGGLDSSVVVGMLSRERNLGSAFTQNTFSARFSDDPTMSEGEYIDAVVRATGATPHNVEPTPRGLMEESQRLHWHQEEPFLSASIYLQWNVARLARDNGTTVLMDGQGADELLGGYQFYFKTMQLDMIERGEFQSLETQTRQFTHRMTEAARRYQDSSRRFNAASAYTLKELEALKSAETPVYHALYDVGVPTPQRGRRLRRTLAEAMQWNSLPILLRYADRNAMAFSREPRLPYLDYDLVDFAISMPDWAYLSDGWQKYVLREAGAGYIPESVRYRADKVGYAAPLDIWMRGPMRAWSYERIFEGPATQVEGYDRAALSKLWHEHQKGAANHSWALWRWISLNEWMSIGAGGGWRRDF